MSLILHLKNNYATVFYISMHRRAEYIASIQTFMDATDTDAPFAITEGPEGVLYQLTTPRATGYDGSPFGSVELNKEILSVPSSVPIPGAFWLLGSCLIGIAGFRRKFKK